MKGLIIWAYVSCRSTMATYIAIKKAINVPCEICLWDFKDLEMREKVGFASSEFSGVDTIPVGENYSRGLEVLDKHRGWNHLFCIYQGSKVFRALALEAVRRGERIGIMSESPCEMYSGIRLFLHKLYTRTLLRAKVRDVIRVADFFVNYSGDDATPAVELGWPLDKIIPFGYWPPEIPGSCCKKREYNQPFVILSSGILTKHRGSEILVEALRILKTRGISYRAVITQNGPLLRKLVRKTEKYNLPIDFPGFLPLTELVSGMERCSVYVGAGISEPWGMRLNDALHCGAPLVVSSGMGGVQMVRQYNCGMEFRNGSAKSLADSLEKMALDSEFYNECAKNVMKAQDCIRPDSKAKYLIGTICKKYKGWFD